MLFSSIPFLYYFLPITLILYFLAPKRLKNATLLLASLVFYGWGEPKYLVLMVISILTGYGFGILIEKTTSRKRARLFLVLSILVSLGILGFFKYADFFLHNFNVVTGLSVPLLSIALPIGISFYTFQILSYGVDVYRGDVKAQKNLLDFATYVTMFPQLIAGPIVRYSDIESQLKSRSYSFEQTYVGIRRFIIGLSKKVLLANLLGELCSIFKDSNEKSILFYWMYAIAFMLHIYFDFSGYSDMAIGLGRIFGFHFIENFNYPYLSKSVTEFWRRWHMTLSRFLRDYVYVALGGNRKGRFRTHLNLMLTMLLGGLWHGASWSFLVWGGLHGAFLILHRLWSAAPLAAWLGAREGILRTAWHGAAVLLTFHCVCLAWCFFRLTRFADSVACVRKWVDCDPAKMWVGPWTDPAVWLALALYAGLTGAGEALRRWSARPDGEPALVGAVWGVRLATLGLAALLAPTGASAAFIYFQF